MTRSPLWARLCLLILLLTAPTLARQTGEHFEVEMCPPGTPLQPALNGDPGKTMDLVLELYRRAGPKIGNRLIEPCYLLCLGDLRPYAAWNGFMLDPGPDDDAVIDRLNAYLVPRGYSIHPQPPQDGGKVPAFSLRSLAGLEKRTHDSKLAWVPHYDRSSGWAGYYQWKDDIYKRLPEEGAFDLVEGIMLGYPDAAVDHYKELAWNSWPTTVEATIPAASYYLCGVPIFSLRCQDSTDPGVIQLETDWQSFLQQCYASGPHRRLAAEPDFIAQRLRLHSENRAGSLFEGDSRYAEARRLGLTTATPQGELSSVHERWLAAHLKEALLVATDSADLADLASLGGEVGLSSEHAWLWLLRGSVGGDPASAALFSAFLEQHPQTMEQLYRRELRRQCETIKRRGEAAKKPGWDSEGLSQMLASDYCHDLFSRLSASEQMAVFQAIEARAAYPPLGKLLEEIRAGKSAYSTALQELRPSQPGP